MQADTDSVDNGNHSLSYYVALKREKVPVEMHRQMSGTHAFSRRRTRTRVNE